jgi:sugar phosphate isomerase/epimerase
MKLGINSYTYMWSIGFEGAAPRKPLSGLDLLLQARILGVNLVQTGPNLFMRPEDKQLFINQANQNGIELEFGTHGLNLHDLNDWFEICNQANVKLIRTIPEIDGQVPSTEELVNALNIIKPLLEEYNLYLGLENGNRPSRDLRSAIEQTSSRNIGVVLDLVNSLAVSEGWKEVTQILAPYTMCLHYKDFAIRRNWHRMGFICEGRAAGNGQLDPEWLFRTLEQSKYNFNVILELWTPEQQSLEETIVLEQQWAEASIRFLRQYIAD